MVSFMRSLLIAALLLCGCHKDCVPVLLTVKNPGVNVMVVHRTGAPTDLGTGPLNRVSGVCVGDAIKLTDGQRVYEELLAYGEPMEEKVIALK
jgi:hypothetical protein